MTSLDAPAAMLGAYVRAAGTTRRYPACDEDKLPNFRGRPAHSDGSAGVARREAEQSETHAARLDRILQRPNRAPKPADPAPPGSPSDAH
jgi:hypothetical protein